LKHLIHVIGPAYQLFHEALYGKVLDRFYVRSVWYSLKPSAGLSHDIASDIHVWSVGGASAGASRLLMVTEISFGHPSCQYVNGVPHFEQNVRTTDADE
jgi:hypothetical protein